MKKSGEAASDAEDETKDAASGIGKAVEKIVSDMEKMANALGSRVEKIGTGYEKFREKLKSLASDHQKTISGFRSEIAELEKSLSALTDPTSARQKDFRAAAAEKVVEIEKELAETKAELEKAKTNDERAEILARQNELQNALAQNASFIGQIDAEIQEAKKVSEMDELTRLIYRFNQETEELRKKYTADIAALNEKIAVENAAYQKQATHYANIMQKMAQSALERMAKTELWSDDHLKKEIEKSQNFFDNFNNILAENAESAEIQNLISVLDNIFEKAQRAIQAAQKAASLGGASLGGSAIKFANGGISSGFPAGITSGPITNFGNAIAGEAGPEAIVPLPNGRSIPVEMRGGASGGGIVVNISVAGSVWAERDLTDAISNEIARKLSFSGVRA
jgi:multidrug efflux pump subunit AcrA (membrane-fusion protein)